MKKFVILVMTLVIAAPLLMTNCEYIEVRPKCFFHDRLNPYESRNCGYASIVEVYDHSEENLPKSLSSNVGSAQEAHHRQRRSTIDQVKQKRGDSSDGRRDHHSLRNSEREQNHRQRNDHMSDGLEKSFAKNVRREDHQRSHKSINSGEHEMKNRRTVGRGDHHEDSNTDKDSRTPREGHRRSRSNDHIRSSRNSDTRERSQETERRRSRSGNEGHRRRLEELEREYTRSREHHGDGRIRKPREQTHHKEQKKTDHVEEGFKNTRNGHKMSDINNRNHAFNEQNVNSGKHEESGRSHDLQKPTSDHMKSRRGHEGDRFGKGDRKDQDNERNHHKKPDSEIPRPEYRNGNNDRHSKVQNHEERHV
ncbi:hypothetical protein ACFFRR_004504 [Megaselia abdita]